jgi:hypothetical protein
MRIDAKTVAQETWPAPKPGKAPKTDVIYWDEDLPGFGLRLRKQAGGRVRKTFVVQYRHNGISRRYLVGSADVLTPGQARDQSPMIEFSMTRSLSVSGGHAPATISARSSGC